MKPALAIMAKAPEPGRTKTRLCPPLAPEQAAEVYAACVRDVIDNTRQLPGVETGIALTPPEGRAWFERIAPGVPVWPVAGATIGRCLDVILTSLLQRGHPRAAAVSSDSPDLWPEIIARGLELLDEAEVVFGPSPDGGYYFVGLKRPAPALFDDAIPWSTSGVLAESLARARRAGLTVRLLAEPVSDVDTYADLMQLRGMLQSHPPQRARHTRAVLARLAP